MPKDFNKSRGLFVQTYSGISFDLENPRPEMFNLDDLHNAQSHMSRFIGSKEFYSCAQSSVIGSYLAEDMFGYELACAYIARFAPRLYMGILADDLRAIHPEIRQMERKIGRATLAAFDMDPDLFMCEEMVEVSYYLEACEWRDLKPNSTAPFYLPDPDPGLIINPMQPKEAYAALHDRCFNELFAHNQGKEGMEVKAKEQNMPKETRPLLL